MLKIKKNNFKIKFTEINLRQRMYQKQSYVTVNIMTEFYPTIVDDCVIGGAIDIKLDLANIKSLNDLNGIYKGDVGSVTISVNNDGVWEHNICDNYEIEILNRKGKEMKFKLKTDNCSMETVGNIVSLYSTSSTPEELGKNFDLEEFFDKPISKQIGNSVISRYFMR